MKLSVIIPTYNEENVIAECILSMDRQTSKDFEIIVVDDGSTDKTAQIISKLKSKISNLVLLEQNHKGAGEARNLGGKYARGEILVFVDADMTFDKGFLKNLVKPIESGKVKGTFSKMEYVSNWENVWSRCWNINQNWEPKKRHPKNYSDTQKVFRAILKSEFIKVGGFSKGGYTDDWSLSDKLGYKAISAPGAIFYHKNPENLSEVLNQAIWVGKREYKLGIFGKLLALIRVNPQFSLLLGIYKAIKYHCWEFVIFKVVYDFGIALGIINYTLTKSGSK